MTRAEGAVAAVVFAVVFGVIAAWLLPRWHYAFPGTLKTS